MSKRLYLAGPMRGHEMYNFPAFDAEALRLRRAGYQVVNPAELDRVNGVHEFTDPLPKGWRRTVMERDLPAICGCDGLALLPGWGASSGCQVEIALARFLGLRIAAVGEWLVIGGGAPSDPGAPCKCCS